MLESLQFLIGPKGADGARAIVDASSGARLGFAIWREGGGPWWWPTAPVLAVHEDEDAPLVFTVQRRWNWPPRREVRDAEGNRIGELIGDWIRDEYARRVATRVCAGGQTLLINRERKVLARYRVDSKGLHFAFATEETEGDPFQKMLLLAAGLIDGT